MTSDISLGLGLPQYLTVTTHHLQRSLLNELQSQPPAQIPGGTTVQNSLIVLVLLEA